MSELHHDPEKLIASELNHFEWLTLESLWASIKVPFHEQWRLWHAGSGMADPSSELGITIGGNLQRAKITYEYAQGFGTPEKPDPDFLAQTAQHVGKVAASFVSTISHFRTPPSEWHGTLDQHLETHLVVVEEVLETEKAKLDGEESFTSLGSDYYYAELEPIYATVKNMQSPDHSRLLEQSKKVLPVAAVAASTWINILRQSPNMALDPGGTPRSSGEYIARLQQKFKYYAPLIQQAISSKQA